MSSAGWPRAMVCTPLPTLELAGQGQARQIERGLGERTLRSAIAGGLSYRLKQLRQINV
jgi:hypothetical protein